MPEISQISLIIFLMPGAAVAVTVVAHIATSRCFPRLGVYRAQFAGIAIGILVMAILTISTPLLGSELAGRALANAIIFICFCYVYFHFNNMGETARRIRLLRDLMAAGRPLTFNEIVARYGAREIIERRLGRLVASGQVHRIDGRYVVANRSIYFMAWLVGMSHWMIFGYRRLNPVRPK
jgi:hypothetical protein